MSDVMPSNSSREKFWQKKAGRMARIANWMYQNVDERNLSEDEVDTAHEMQKEVMEYIDFDE